MNWSWTKAPPVMQRTLADDLKVGLFILVGATLGFLVFGDGQTSLLVGSILGVVLMVVALNVVRRIVRRS